MDNQTDYAHISKILEDTYTILTSSDYSVPQVADKLRDYYAIYYPKHFNYIARAALGLGHIQLAEALLERGATPLSVEPKTEISFGRRLFINQHYSEETIAHVPMLLAMQPLDHIVQEKNDGLRKTRVEVLEYLEQHPGIWPDEIDRPTRRCTPLINSEALHRKYSRWGISVPFVLTDERRAFQKALIERGADVNANYKGRNFLQAFIPDASDPIVDMSGIDHALALGADPHLQGPSAWARAIRTDTGKKTYTRKSDLGPRCQALQTRNVSLHSYKQSASYFSPIAAAVSMGHLKLTQKMIDDGIDPCWTCTSSGLNLISINSNPNRIVLSALALFPVGSFTPIINQPTKAGDTTLHQAVNELNIDIVKRVLAEGADINIENRQGRKPLSAIRRFGKAAQQKFDAVITEMIMQEADLSAERGQTAMHKAAVMMSVSAMQALIDKGHRADLFKRDTQGRTPVEMVLIGHQNMKSSQYNTEHGENQIKALRFIEAQGVDLLSTFKDGRTLLHDALHRKSHLAASYLIDSGANMFAKNKDGKTPLDLFENGYYMAADKKPENQKHIQMIVEACINAGLDINAPNEQGKLHFKNLRENPWFVSILENIALRQNTIETTPSVRRMRL